MPDKIPAETNPDEFHSVRLWLPDGRTVSGVWTGKVWWAEGREAFPTHWEEFTHRAHSTHGPKQE